MHQESRHKHPSLAKITRPRLPRVLERDRLFRLLDDDRSHSVIWITGPAGSGKTTLVASYLDSRKLPCLWYQVDAGDADPATFFYYLGFAAKKAAPRHKRPLPLLTPEYLMGVKTFTLRYFENLFSRLHPRADSSTPGGFVLVFDNYQEAPEASLFHEVFTEGLSRVPEGITVIILSRSEPPPIIAPLRVNRRMEVIGWDELRLRFEETEGIVRQLRDEKISGEILRQIHQKADGWAAGLVLMLERAGKEPAGAPVHTNPAPQEIFDYFAREIFERAGAEIQAFLLKTSSFRKFTADMAAELTQNPQAAQKLSDLSRKNYFTQRHAAETPVYQYHSLFREFLLEQALEACPGDELRRIRHHAAKLCEGAAQNEDAVELFLEGGAWDDATRLVLRQAPALVSQGRGMTLAGWIGSMPESVISHAPHLLFWRGVCDLPFSPPRGREYLEKAFRLFEAGQDTEGVFLAWSAIVNSFMSEWDDFTPLDPWIEWLDKRLSDSSTPPPAVYSQVAVSMIWALTFRKPWHPDIQSWADRAMSLSQNHPDPNLRIQACIAVSTFHYFMGENAQGVLPAAEGKRIARVAEVSPLTLLGMKFIEIILHWISSAPGSSSHLISEGLAIAEKTGMHVYDSMLYSYAVCDFLTKGDLAGAGELLRKMEPMIRGNQRGALGHYHYVVAWYYFLLNDLPNAAVHAERGVQIPFETGMPFGEVISRILLAYVFQEKGEPGKAFEQIEMARKIGRKTKSSLLEWLYGLAEAWVAFNKGEEKFGLESLKKAMAIGRAKGIMNYEGWLPSVMTVLCLKSLQNGIEVGYVRSLVRKRGLIPSTPPYDCERWPWPLRIHTLGRFEIAKDERPLQYPRKSPRMPLELLKAVISGGVRGISEDRLVDALWPEADGVTAHQTFATTLHRLRNLLGDEKALLLRDGRVAVDLRTCWVDAFAFEALLERAEPLWEGKQLPEAVRLTEKALALYGGPFVGEGAGEAWAVSFRERLRSKFARAVKRLGHYYEKNGESERAAEHYRKGLEADNLEEEFYQCLMSCCLATGRKAEAMTVYERCRHTLSAALGLEPSPETEAIYKKIKPKE